MNLEFKILWYDDNMELIKGFIKNLKRYLEDDEGFECEIVGKIGATNEEVNELALSLDKYNDYDLIILDYNLQKSPGSMDGHELAKSLREKIATDMILYSSDGVETLRQELCDKGVDAVSVVNRKRFDEDIKKLVSKQIKRTFDMDNLRGFVLQQIAEIEAAIRNELTTEVLTTLESSRQESVTNKLREKLKEKVAVAETNLNNIEAFEDTISAFKDYKITDFATVRTRLAKLKNVGVLKEGKQTHKLQDHRNYLAHEPSKIDANTGKLVVENKFGSSIEFDYSKFKELRKLVLEIRNELGMVKVG